jgi:hypothetical protein
MSALMEVVSLAHENMCIEGFAELIDSIKELLTRRDVDRFSKLCGRVSCVGRSEYELCEMYDEHLVDGETRFVQVSIGMMTDEQDLDDEAIGCGDYASEMGRVYFRLFHQMSAYCAYLEHCSAQENEYFDEFMVSYI